MQAELLWGAQEGASPNSTPTSTGLTITLSPQAPLCNGTMVWSVNFTTGVVRTLVPHGVGAAADFQGPSVPLPPGLPTPAHLGA